MKQAVNLLSLLFLSSMIISSCGDYEEGPKISLRSKKSRLEGKWLLVKVDGEDAPNQALGIKYKIYHTYEKDGDGEIEVKYDDPDFSDDRTDFDWIWKNNKKSIELEGRAGDKVELDILRLTDKEFKFKAESSLQEFEKVD